MQQSSRPLPPKGNHLDCYEALQAELARLVDDTHAAAAGLGQDFVARQPREDGREAGRPLFSGCRTLLPASRSDGLVIGPRCPGLWGRRRARLGPEAIGFDFAALPGWRAAQWVDDRAGGADLVLIYAPPHAETEARIAVRAARLVVVPVQPSPLDL